MQSTRSALSLLGTVLVGRFSDRFGRATLLWIGTFASLFSYLINFFGTNLTAMWLSMIPSALLNQNFSVLKALFADYSEELGYSESDRASAIGRLGMSVGLSFMIGPVVGASLMTNYNHAIISAICSVIISAGLLLFLPVPKKLLKSNPVSENNLSSKLTDSSSSSSSSGVNIFVQLKRSTVQFFDLPVLKTRGAQVILSMRLAMGLAFSIFMTIWTVSLNARFTFGPKDHAYFMGWVGLWYALSQGIIAKQCIRIAGNDPTNIVLSCVLCLRYEVSLNH